MEGNIVHKWQVPIEQYWDTANAQNRGFNPQLAHVGWRAAKALPNGDLIFIAIAYRSPWGLAMVRVDKDSRVIWSYLKNAHHDFDIGDDGRIYLLTHDIIQTAPKGLEFLDMPAFDERINILSPDGKELYEFSLLEAIGRSKYKEVLLKGGETNMKGDLLHTNTVKVIGPSFARHAPFAREGQVALFFREKNALAIFDLKEEKIVWAKTGFGKGAHDPDFLDNGQILLFDNKGLSNGWSRVVFMDSKNFNILRSIEGHPDRPFVSAIRSRQQWLPNGNVMITESDTGRLFEVSQTDEIVWEYVNPVRRSVNGKTYVPVIMGGVRYRADDLKFLNQS
ncbi:MAG: hypothetical protein GWN38_18925 [Nitrospinaceae bacterium]|nr:hypothetical protein [Nitrospinaceae bacterium]NIW07739.1 hypothetical protein [Nitrospinaceae bacterium]